MSFLSLTFLVRYLIGHVTDRLLNVFLPLGFPRPFYLLVVFLPLHEVRLVVLLLPGHQPMVVVVVIVAAAATTAAVIVIVIAGPPHFFDIHWRPKALHIPVVELQEVQPSVHGCRFFGVHNVYAVSSTRLGVLAMLSV